MKAIRITTFLAPDVEAALRDTAAEDGMTVAEFLDEAIGKEVRRRMARRKALYRNRLSARLEPLEPSAFLDWQQK
ncbi:hypothetical protein [Marivivens marinus]|uniref:hypothetical protein n=1 Tax=Marivivens marinus TaxID=3110173 RepID=UPI003B8480CB